MAHTLVADELLAFHLQAAFGSGCRLLSAERMSGGTRKQVFRLELSTPHRPVILLAWHNEHDYFNERADPEGNLSDAVAPRLYAANTRLLLENGVRVPEIYMLDDSHTGAPFTFALVEYVRGLSFHGYQAAFPGRPVAPILEKMRDYLSRMHALKRPHWGTVLDSPSPVDYSDDFLTGVLPDLEGLARVHAEVGQMESKIRDRLLSMRQGMAPRSSYSFIHNELGPDEHFMIDEQDEITMLDIDGCHYADLERDHAYLKLRFGDLYPALRCPGLDPDRMAFYGLALHIMAAFGHYQLLVKGFADEPDLRRIYEWNAAQVVRWVSA